jgi:hypothetical protein
MGGLLQVNFSVIKGVNGDRDVRDLIGVIM